MKPEKGGESDIQRGPHKDWQKAEKTKLENENRSKDQADKNKKGKREGGIGRKEGERMGAKFLTVNTSGNFLI